MKEKIKYLLKILGFTACYMAGFYWIGQLGNTEWIYFGMICVCIYAFLYMIFYKEGDR